MIVPKSNVVPMTVPAAHGPQIEPKYLAMAAAVMHQQGRLIENPKETDASVKPTL